MGLGRYEGIGNAAKIWSQKMKYVFIGMEY